MHTILTRKLPFAVIWLLVGLPTGFAPSTAMDFESDQVVAPVFVKPAQEKILTATVVGFGKVQSEPASIVSVEALRDGIVNKVEVRAGQTIAQGEPMAEFTTAAATEEAYRKAKSELDFAKTNLDRMRVLYATKAASLQQLDQAEVAFKNAQAALGAQTGIGAQMQRETIRASISGTVTAVSISEGDRVKQGAKLFTLAPSNALAVLLGIEPEDVVNVKTGMPVSLIVATEPQQKFTGRVTAVNKVNDPLTRLVDVMVGIEQPPHNPPLIGTFMRGDIILKQEKVLVVPRTALLYGHDGVYLFIVKDGRAHRVAVRLGLEGGSDVAVTGQVKLGELVVVQGNYELTDGMKVRLVKSELQ